MLNQSPEKFEIPHRYDEVVELPSVELKKIIFFICLNHFGNNIDQIFKNPSNFF